MYIPRSFSEEDLSTLHAFMRANNFATLVSQYEGQMTASHIPFMLASQPGQFGLLTAHLARANSQWKQFQNGQEVLVIFQGTHAYISPSWYETHPSVPTWNYTAVHAYGVPKVIDDRGQLYSMLEALVHNHEDARQPAWEMQLPDDYMDKMMQSIIGFEIEITRLEGKYKLSQNRSDVDQQSVIDHLKQSEHVLDVTTGELMADRREQVVP